MGHAFRRFTFVEWGCGAVLALLIAGVPAAAQSVGEGEINRLRRQLKHEEALEKMKASEEAEIDPALLSSVTLEAALLQKLGPPVKRKVLGPKGVVEKLATLGLSDREELTLAGLCYLLDIPHAAEDALHRARTKNYGLKNQTDDLIARHRGEDVPPGGYLQYRGRFIPAEERNERRILDEVIEGLYGMEIKGLIWRFVPSSTAGNYDRFLAFYGEEGPRFFRRAATLMRKELKEIYQAVRGWIPSYSNAAFRQRIQDALAALAPLRAEDLALIRRYDKPEQPKVDEYRKKLELLYSEYGRLVDGNLGRIRNLRPERGYESGSRVNACEEMLAQVDRYLGAYAPPGLGPAEIRPGRGADVSGKHLLPGRAQSNLEDVLWLVLNFVAGRTIDVLQRTDEILIQEKALTSWEKWLVRQVRIEAIERYNREMATSLDTEERAFIDILNGYRKMLGLYPFEVEERCVVAARKHSQEMVDLNYFGHISPIRRNRTPSDRVRLEGFAGGVGENCLAGGGFVSARGAFEGWYHSPGHHRLLVSGSAQTGVGAASGHRMWTMVAGGPDLTWRHLHEDLPPAKRAVLQGLVTRFSEDAGRGAPPSDEAIARLAATLPSVLPLLAKEAFEAVGAKTGVGQASAPALLGFLIEAEVPDGWRPLQVAAVAAAGDLMDTGESREGRGGAFQVVRPLVSGDYGFDPAVSRGERRPAVAAIRKEWEDEAQWQYRTAGLSALKEPEALPGRKGDGPALVTPLKVLDKKERLRLAKLYGGGKQTERSVEMGLAWLARVQSEDGAWRARSLATRLSTRNLKPGSLGKGRAEWEIAMTGLALLPFIYAGSTTIEGEYAETVDRGARFLLARIVDYGMFETTSSHYMYSHAIATQALCELYAYSADPYIGVAAQLCMDYLIYAQDPVTGGWRYRAKEAGDTSVTGWVILAMHSARKADLDIAGLRDAIRFLDRVTYPTYFEVGYLNNRDGGHHRLCAVGSLSRLFITGNKQDARIYFNARRLLRTLPRPGAEDFYYWYYATLLLFQMEGKYWSQWNEALLPALLHNQIDDRASPLHGSFTPRGPYSDQGGRVYQTSLGLLILMTYYRYDRALKSKVGPWTGNLREEVAPYMKVLRSGEDPVVADIADRKMVDKFGSALVPVLVEALKKEGEEKPFRERMASMLSRCAAPRFEALIMEVLRGEGDNVVRHFLVQALDGICTSRSVPALIAYLDDGDRIIRGYSASALGRIGDTAAVVPLSDRLEKEKDGWCRTLIQEALQRLAHEEALAVILDDALGEQDAGRLRIREKLKALERTRLAGLLRQLKSTEPRLYSRILEALGEHGEWAAVPIALIGLESANLETRSESVKALRTLTRRNHGFDPAAPREKRQKAIERWQAWWKKTLGDTVN